MKLALLLSFFVGCKSAKVENVVEIAALEEHFKEDARFWERSLGVGMESFSMGPMSMSMPSPVPDP